MLNTSKPFIIAEVSANHNQDLNRAFKLMECAKKAGASAIKLQTYTPDTLTIDHDGDDFMIFEGLWKGYKLYDLYQKGYMPWEWHAPLFEKGRELGIPVFSTPCDETAVDFLEQFNPPFYKIGSFELVHIPLIKKVAKLKKPMIISTGMANQEEIARAVQTAQSNGCQDLTLLHCVSDYPTQPEDCNLALMLDLAKNYPNVKIGLSDHTLGITVAIAAVALGARVIEKHFTLSRAEGGVDSAFSLEPDELESLCQETEKVVKAIGRVNYERSEMEKKYKAYRPSIYVVKNIQSGDKFTQENIRVLRPGLGASPLHYESLLGKTVPCNMNRGDRVNWEDLKASSEASCK